jgi:signal transduction histidine kinase
VPAHTLTRPGDTLERQNEKLRQIAEVLMRRVERAHDDSGAAYSLFQRAVLLEDQVRERTRDLERALDLLNESNARLAEANRETEKARADLAGAIEAINEGFALFDISDRLLLCNSRFGMHMPDILPRLKPGLSFTDYVAIVSRSRHLRLPPGESPEMWAETRLARHREERALFNVELAGDRWVQVSEQRMPGGQTVVMQTDVSDIVRLEREERGKLIDDQARLIRATLEHLNQGVCIFDSARRLVGFNQRLATLLSIPVTQLRPGIDFELVFRRMERELEFSPGTTPEAVLDWVLSSERRRPLRFEIRRGESQVLDVFAQEMPDRGFVISFTDVSIERAAARALADANERLEQRVAERTLELEDALAAAERANAARNRFVAAASHDLLQPLSAAKLFLSSIEEELADPRHREVLDKAQNALLGVEDMIQALLDISRLEAGRTPVEIEATDLGLLLDQLRDEFTPMAALKGLRLRVVRSTLKLQTDPRLFRRILQNLISNAVRYTHSGGVLVGVRRCGRTARVEVIDTGPGIPEHEHENIFREFHRLDARASASEGLGLGLAIVERACALLNHPLSLRSAPGEGTVFGVTAPLATAPGGLVRPAGATGPDPGWLPAGLVVLLIENDADIRHALRLLLGKWDVEVIEVGSGAEAVRLIGETEFRPDAVLADFRLDGEETGLDAIAAVGALVGPVPARVITASRNPEVLRRCGASGVEVLHKPLRPQALHDFLRGLTPAAAAVRG